MRISKDSIKQLVEDNKNLTKRISETEGSLSRLKHDFKIHEINQELEEYDLILREEYYQSYSFIKYYGIIDIFTWEKIKTIIELDDFYDWFSWYKSWIEDWAVVVELNEEETEKVKDKKCECEKVKKSK